MQPPRASAALGPTGREHLYASETGGSLPVHRAFHQKLTAAQAAVIPT